MTEAIAGPKTKIEIISQAALLCGKQTFQSLDSGGAFALDGDQVFNSLVAAELGSNRWRFAQAHQAMGILTTLNPTFDGWQYYWNMPSEAIMFFRVYPAVDSLVFGRKVLTKTNQSLTAIYAKSVPVSEWPPTFSWYIVHAIAAVLGISVTKSDRILARIQTGMELWHSRALFSDGQSSKGRPIQSNPYLDVRQQFRSRGR